MENTVKIQGIIQKGYDGKPGVFQTETRNGQFLTKFTIKHTVDGRSMFIPVIKWSDKQPGMTLSDGMEIQIVGKLTQEQYKERDSDITRYRLAVSPDSIKIIENIQHAAQQPEAQPEAQPQQTESLQENPSLDNSEGIPF